MLQQHAANAAATRSKCCSNTQRRMLQQHAAANAATARSRRRARVWVGREPVIHSAITINVHCGHNLRRAIKKRRDDGRQAAGARALSNVFCDVIILNDNSLRISCVGTVPSSLTSTCRGVDVALLKENMKSKVQERTSAMSRARFSRQLTSLRVLREGS